MIFNLFKSKPTLKELIPNGFVDIHSHILPGIDDGAKNIDESIHLIGEMKKIGFSKIIGTPHTYPGLYNNTISSIRESYNKLKNIDFKIDYASEYMIDISLIEKSERKKLLCLKKNYVLLETGFTSPNINFHEIIYKIQINGYEPILAHPERYLYLNGKNDSFKLKDLGCKFQLNLFSITGLYGRKIIDSSNFFLKNNMYDFVGSDIHNLNQLKEYNKKIKTSHLKNLKKSIENNQLFN